MANHALQELSKRYVRGEFSRPEYRQQRRKIIDDATGVKSSVPSGVETDAQPEPASQKAGSNNLFSNVLFKKASVVSAIIVATLILLYSTL